MNIEQDILFRLDEISETLKRIETRQIKTTALVEDVKEHEGPVVGIFASSYQKEEEKPRG